MLWVWVRGFMVDTIMVKQEIPTGKGNLIHLDPTVQDDKQPRK